MEIHVAGSSISGRSKSVMLSKTLSTSGRFANRLEQGTTAGTHPQLRAVNAEHSHLVGRY